MNGRRPDKNRMPPGGLPDIVNWVPLRGRPDLIPPGKKWMPPILDEGETPGDQMEEFPTSEFPITMAELQAATGRFKDPFKIREMFEIKRRQKDNANLLKELQRIEEEAPRAAYEKQREIRMKEMMAEEGEEEEAKQRQMAEEQMAEEQMAEEQMAEEQMAEEQQRPYQTDAAKAYFHDQPRAQLIKNLKKKYGDRGGRRRSKKSDTKKSKNKSKYRSRSRSRISTKRKNKNRRQTRK
jgi:hypothetical protein